MAKAPAKAITDSAYKVRMLRASEFDRAEDIWVLAFGKGWTRDYFRERMTGIYGAFAGDQLHAVAAEEDFQMFIANQWVACGGISAVATAPGQRYQSLVRYLLTQILTDLNERRVPLSALHPFSYPFYEKMGWAVTHNQYKIETTAAALKSVSSAGTASNWRMLALSDCESITPTHERWSETWNMSIRRPAKVLRHFMHAPNTAWQLFAHADGYMLWDINLSERERCLNVVEFAYLTEQAYLDGLALLAQMDSQYDRIVFNDGRWENFFKLGLPHPKPSIELRPRMMSRVVNVGAFESLIPGGLCGISLRDPLGVSATTSGDAGIGEIVQHVTGYWAQPASNLPRKLHRVTGDKVNYCVERF